MTRRRTEHCVSDLQLDRLISGELGAGGTKALRAHLAECTACRARHGELLEDHRGFSEKMAPFSAKAPSPPPRLWLAAGSIAAAAALWVLVIREPASEGAARLTKEETLLETRTKGRGIELDWVIRRGDQVFARRANEPVQPGDALRFSVRVTRTGHVAILSLDGAGQLSVYHEWSPVQAGERQLLPGAVQLDGFLGVERWYAIFCAQPSPLTEIERAIREDAAQPRWPPGCDVERHEVRKEPL